MRREHAVWASIPAQEIPNFHVLHALLDFIRKESGSASFKLKY